MLASGAVRTAGQPDTVSGAGAAAVAAAAGAVSFCALFFSGGFSDAPLVWIGGLALLLAALSAAAVVLRALPAPGLDGPATLFLGCLFGLAVWVGLTMLWSTSPDTTWAYTNRTLVYAAFGLAGVLVAALVSREVVARAAALLLGLVLAWALLAKCVPGLYPDYGRIARLRAPVGYWNELALLCDAAVPLALWLATRARTRVAGVLLLYVATVALLLTYSRFGVALACLVAAAWTLLDRSRIESLAAVALGGGAGAAAFGIALALPGITHDGEPRAVRAHDGWIFALVVLAGAAVAAGGGAALRFELAPERRRRLERVAGGAALLAALAGLAVSIVFAHRIWSEFTSPSQIASTSGRFGSASSSNRWTWWQEAWHAFTRHPLGGTGAGTFDLTDLLLRHTANVTTDEPHNTPLQFLSETGIVGFLLYVGALAGAAWGALRRDGAATLALGLAFAAFAAHMVVDMDWNYVATCGPLLLVGGVLVGGPRTAAERVPARRPLLALGAVLVAFAAVYSLTAPWLAQRQLATETSAADAKHAHSLDPLSTRALIDWAAFEDAGGNVLHARKLYLDAVALEPRNAETWYALGEFYFGHKAWKNAYVALNNAYTYDRYGPAGDRCGLLDRARWNAFREGVKCPGSTRAASP
jgi:hypothetical protein